MWLAVFQLTSYLTYGRHISYLTPCALCVCIRRQDALGTVAPKATSRMTGEEINGLWSAQLLRFSQIAKRTWVSFRYLGRDAERDRLQSDYGKWVGSVSSCYLAEFFGQAKLLAWLSIDLLLGWGVIGWMRLRKEIAGVGSLSRGSSSWERFIRVPFASCDERSAWTSWCFLGWRGTVTEKPGDDR